MKTINSVFLICSIFLFYCCNKESDKIELSEPIILRDDLSATEFKKAIISEWKSVYENSGFENVIYLKFDDQNKSRIILKKDNIEKEYSGDYVISFLREPAEGNITLAKIIISSSEKEIELSRVNFSQHNALHSDTGLFLRIEDPPYGVLERID